MIHLDKYFKCLAKHNTISTLNIFKHFSRDKEFYDWVILMFHVYSYEQIYQHTLKVIYKKSYWENSEEL